MYCDHSSLVMTGRLLQASSDILSESLLLGYDQSLRVSAMHSRGGDLIPGLGFDSRPQAMAQR